MEEGEKGEEAPWVTFPGSTHSQQPASAASRWGRSFYAGYRGLGEPSPELVLKRVFVTFILLGSDRRSALFLCLA